MKTRQSQYVFLAVALMTVSEMALAGTGGSFLDGLKTFIQTSLEGTLGIVIGLAGLLYGLVAGIARGSLGGLGIGVGLAAAAYYGPNIVSTMATATLAGF
ncbi:MAG: hypothetical protein KJZ92_15420 [Rhodocyclaceae bacterium]|nr:hypothetical protein [Opitutaceae bacterium]MCL4682642.1 hypothetical protein [Rhodocyclaceae bacterium]